MKIAIDARMINSSTGRYAERLLHYLQELDTVNTYTVIVPTKDRDYWTPTNANFNVVTTDVDFYSFAEQTTFYTFIESLNADLVHFTMPQQPVRYKKPHVTTVHDLTLLKTYNSDKNWFVYHFKQLVARSVFKIAAESSRTVVTPSEYTKQEVQTYFGISPEKISVTYEAADSINAAPIPYTLPSNEYLLYVGQQSDYKNIRRLVLAHQELIKNHPKLHLVLVGGKNKALRTNEAWVQKNNYQQVIFTGFVDDGQLNWLYANATCYVFPSLMEGFGLPGLEAMRAGCPVVSSNATCLPEIYGNAAHYFDPTSIADMTAKIGQILTDAALRSTLINNGTVRVNEYSWERTARQTLAIYAASVSESSQAA